MNEVGMDDGDSHWYMVIKYTSAKTHDIVRTTVDKG